MFLVGLVLGLAVRLRWVRALTVRFLNWLVLSEYTFLSWLVAVIILILRLSVRSGRFMVLNMRPFALMILGEWRLISGRVPLLRLLLFGWWGRLPINRRFRELWRSIVM